jgi:hypothetical protein
MLKNTIDEFIAGWVQAKQESITQHPIVKLLENNILSEVETLVKKFQPTYKVKASTGSGNWAQVPWLSILNPEITTTTQSGIYPVYLFCADGGGVYLSMGLGTTELKNKFGAIEAKEKAKGIRKKLRSKISALNSWNDDVSLNATTNLGRSYEWASVGARFYPANQIPSDKELGEDLSEMIEIYANVANLYVDLFAKTEEPHMDTAVRLVNISKPFLLLAGISGTGKSRFVREQAKASGSLSETYQLVSVRPDWHEPSDLLGYTTRLGGKAEYIVTDVLTFLVKAWKAIVAAGVELDGNNASGAKADLARIAPYWLCLDEMNLAPVEQYFADYLSILETREWQWDDEKFIYQCDPILAASVFKNVDFDALRETLNLEGVHNDSLWQHFCSNGIGLPFNLIVAGTVNMDETTHGFSRKVIDRALSIDFGEFFPNDFAEYFSPQSKPKALTYPVWSSGRDIEKVAPVADVDGNKSIAFISEINAILEHTPFQLAYRAANELLLGVMAAAPATETQLMAVWDDFMMCKVLPRIEGDIDKLAIVDSAGSDGQETILSKLENLLSNQLEAVWPHTNRPDLYREPVDPKHEEVLIACHSRQKLAWMRKRLESSGFTSFWP